MTESTRENADRWSRLLKAAQQELARFEREESDFRKKDRQERAAELKLPLSKIELQ
jgi:hypothetical protein